MKKFKAILISDHEIENGYLIQFLENQKSNLSSLDIVNIGGAKNESKSLYKQFQNVLNHLIPLPVNKIQISELSYIELMKYGNRIVDILILENIIAEKDPPVIFFSNYSHFYLVVSLKKRIKAKVITLADKLHWEEHQSGDQHLYDKREELMYTQSDLVICSSKERENFLHNQYSISSEKLKTWTFKGKLIAEINFEPEYITELKKHYSMDAKELILFNCKKASLKDYNLFIEAITPVLLKNKNIRVIITGKTDFILPDYLKPDSWYQFMFTGDITDQQYLKLVTISNMVVDTAENPAIGHLMTDILFRSTPVIIKDQCILSYFPEHPLIISFKEVAGEANLKSNAKILNNLITAILNKDRKKQFTDQKVIRKALKNTASIQINPTY